MRCFTPPPNTRFYAGVDRHARNLFLVVLDRDGHERFARNLPATPAAFLKAVFTTPQGWAMIVAGMAAGFVFAAVAMAVSVISFPLLLDRDVGAITAVKTSLKAVSANPRVTIARPEAAFYNFFSVDGVSDTRAFCKKLAKDYKVGLAPGEAFAAGGPGNIRLCFASGAERLSQGLDRIEAAIKAL